MANDIGSAVQMLKGILGDGAEDKIKAVMDGLNMANSNSSTDDISTPIQTQASEIPRPPALPTPNLDNLQSMLNIKGMIDSLNATNDSRSRLLSALRPYMRSTRQRGIDSAIRLMNLTKLTGLFK